MGASPGEAGVAARLGAQLATYRVLAGINYSGKRVEPGAIVDDLPAKSVGWLASSGVIEKVDEPQPSKPAPKSEPFKSPKPSKGDED